MISSTTSNDVQSNFEKASQNLVEFAQSGDKANYEIFIRLCIDYIYQSAFARIGDQKNAEDITQDCFIHLMKSAKKYDPYRPLKPWLSWHVQISSNRFIRLEKSLRQRKEKYKLMQNTANSSAHASSPIEVSEQKTCIRKALSSLKKNDRIIIELHYFDELSQREVADTLNISENAVAVRLHRARERLKNILKKLSPLTSITALSLFHDAYPAVSPKLTDKFVENCLSTNSISPLHVSHWEITTSAIKAHPILLSLTASCLVSIPIIFSPENTSPEKAISEISAKAIKEKEYDGILNHVIPFALEDYYTPQVLPFFKNPHDGFDKNKRRRMFSEAATSASMIKGHDELQQKEGSPHTLGECIKKLHYFLPTDIELIIQGFYPNSPSLPLAIKNKKVGVLLDEYAVHYDFTYKVIGKTINILPPKKPIKNMLNWVSDEKCEDDYLPWLKKSLQNRLIATDIDNIKDADSLLSLNEFQSINRKYRKFNPITLQNYLDDLSTLHGLKWLIKENKLFLTKEGLSFIEQVHLSNNTIQEENKEFILSKLHASNILTEFDTEMTINFRDATLKDTLDFLKSVSYSKFLCDPKLFNNTISINGDFTFKELLEEISKKSNATWHYHKGIFYLKKEIQADS